MWGPHQGRRLRGLGRPTVRSAAPGAGRWLAGVGVAALLGVTGCTSEVAAPSTQPSSSSEGEQHADTATATAAPESTHALGGYAGEFDAVTQGFRARSEDLQARVDT